MDQLSNLLARAIKNNYFSGALTVFLVLYGSMARPQLPEFVATLFETAVFRLLVLALIAYISTKDLQVALLVAVAFTITMNLLGEQRVAEGFIAGIKEGMIGEEATETNDSDSSTASEDIDEDISSLNEETN